MLLTRVRKARRQSVCGLCRAMILTGQQIGRTRDGRWVHTACAIGRYPAAAARRWMP